MEQQVTKRNKKAIMSWVDANVKFSVVIIVGKKGGERINICIIGNPSISATNQQTILKMYCFPKYFCEEVKEELIY